MAKAAHDNLIAEQDMLRIAQQERKEMEKKLELRIAVARQTELAAKQEADRLAYEREAAQQAQLVADRVTHEQTESYEKPQLSPDEAQFTLGTARMLPQAKFSDMVASHEAPKMAAINNDSKNTPCSAEETSDRFVFGQFVYQKKHPLDIDDDDRKEESKRYAKRPLIDNQTAKMQTIAKQLQKPDLHPASRNRLHADLFALLGGRSSIPMLDEDGNIVDETNNEEQEHSDHVHGMIKGMMSGESSEELSQCSSQHFIILREVLATLLGDYMCAFEHIKISILKQNSNIPQRMAILHIKLDAHTNSFKHNRMLVFAVSKILCHAFERFDARI